MMNVSDRHGLIQFLDICRDEQFPTTEFNPRREYEFRTRCYERNFYDKVIKSIVDDCSQDPEDILFSYFLSMEYEKELVRNNKHRTYIMDRTLGVLNNIEMSLKVYKGDEDGTFN